MGDPQSSPWRSILKISDDFGAPPFYFGNWTMLESRVGYIVNILLASRIPILPINISTWISWFSPIAKVNIVYKNIFLKFLNNPQSSPSTTNHSVALMAACLKIASPVIDADVKPRPLRDRIKLASSWHHGMVEMRTKV